MDSRVLTLGVVAGLAVAGLARRRAAGSADALRPEVWTGLVIGETKEGTPAIVLVDLRVLSEVQSDSDLKTKKNAILGFIATDYPNDSMERPVSTCDDKDGRSPLQVSVAVAQKGWGPLTYDATLWAVAEEATQSEGYNGYLMPDRNNVFVGARKVWVYYNSEKRKGDLLSRKIPKACPHHGYPTPDLTLDRMYKAKLNRPAFAEMDAMYQRWASVRSTLEDRLGMDREEIEAELVKMGEKFFGEKISGFRE
jgi:hypothetical protein